MGINKHVLTFDIDWAPDCAIEWLVNILVEKRIKATWFVTHDSPAIREIFKNSDLFEVGVHPNFLSGSTQGNDEESVMKHVMSLAPSARAMRTHALVQSTPLLEKAVKDFGIKIDVSLALPKTPQLTPHKLYFSHDCEGIVRVPYFFEDDYEMYSPLKCWDFSDAAYHVEGLKVYDFHPTYLYLNADRMDGYNDLKKQGALNTLEEKVLKKAVNVKRPGVQKLFLELCDFIVDKQRISFTISDIVSMWKEDGKG